MAPDLLEPLPLITADLPGIGGRIKVEPEDFEVEEIPAYTPCGSGEFLYLWIEKRDLGAEFFTKQLAKKLGLRPEDVGTAGLKDRRAITRQWVSVPASVESNLNALDGEGMRVLAVSRHGNKLKPGHVRGNRFRIRIRDLGQQASQEVLDALLGRIREQGLPNFYGAQRFGRNQETLELGLRLLTGRESEARPPGKFLRKLALSAVQSALFNRCLTGRMRDGLLHRVLAGDVMAKWPAGGMFTAEDVPAEQVRFDRRETVHAGPMFGKKMFPAKAEAAGREQAVLAAAGLSPASFDGFGKLLQGTRRHNLVYTEDLQGRVEGRDAIVSFTLAAGSYATVLLREITKDEKDDLEGA
jgi:tRNA pseudouridine13 synthase